jgi:hypothetical protein
MTWPLYPYTHCIGGWEGFRAGLDDMEKKEFLILPGLELEPLQSSSPQAVAIWIALSWLPALNAGE